MNRIDKLILTALIIADDEAEKGRTSIILLPCQIHYYPHVKRVVKQAYPRATYVSTPRESVYIRYSTFPSGLRALPADVLIVVDQDHPQFNSDSLLLGRERLRSSIVRKEYNL